MDRYLQAGRIRFDEAFYLKRDRAGRWQEVDAADAWGSPYDHLTTDQGTAGAIVVGIVRSP